MCELLAEELEKTGTRNFKQSFTLVKLINSNYAINIYRSYRRTERKEKRNKINPFSFLRTLSLQSGAHFCICCWQVPFVSIPITIVIVTTQNIHIDSVMESSLVYIWVQWSQIITWANHFWWESEWLHIILKWTQSHQGHKCNYERETIVHGEHTIARNAITKDRRLCMVNTPPLCDWLFAIIKHY